MKAIVLNESISIEENQTPLEMIELPAPDPGEGEILFSKTMQKVKGRLAPFITISMKLPVRHGKFWRGENHE